MLTRAERDLQDCVSFSRGTPTSGRLTLALWFGSSPGLQISGSCGTARRGGKLHLPVVARSAAIEARHALLCHVVRDLDDGEREGWRNPRLSILLLLRELDPLCLCTGPSRL